MGSAFVLTARETLETSLLLGVILACLRSADARRRVRAVWTGVGVAGAASLALAVALRLTVGGLHGRAEAVFEGSLMWIAAGTLTYALLWMRRNAHGLAGKLRLDATAALAGASAVPLFVLAFVSVFREGAELALYLAAAGAGSSGSDVALGAALGFTGAVAAGTVVYRGSRRLPVARFFSVTAGILVVFGAGLVARATQEFQAAGIFPGTIAVWHTRWLPDSSGPGALLRTLLGYSERPSLLSVIFVGAYAGVVATVVVESERPPTHLSVLRQGGSYERRLYRILRSPRLRLLPLATGILFVGLLVVALAGVSIGPFDATRPLRLGSFASAELDGSVFNFLLWVVWLPLLTVFTVLLGRVWCGALCPLRFVSDKARDLGDHVFGRGTTTSSTLRLGFVLPLAFLLITFVVTTLRVQADARAGALLFLAVTGASAVVGFSFRRGTWCRYVCPIGGWLARLARLSPVALRATPTSCATCVDKPCLTDAAAPRCPSFLNPSTLDSDRHCLRCWNCVASCPLQQSSLKLGLRLPGSELVNPRTRDLWEALFVASLLGMYAAVGERSAALAHVPFALVFVGFVVGATLLYVALCALTARIAGTTVREALATIGYVFLPLEFATALIAFGDDALEFLGITQPAAAVLLALGFGWSAVLAVPLLGRAAGSATRALGVAAPVAVALCSILFVWLQWYASGAVVDVT
jgi:high-affinity iron transporter